MTCVPPPTAVMTSESLRLSEMVLTNAMRKKRQAMGMNLPHRPSSLDSCCRTASAAAAKKPSRCCCCSAAAAAGCCCCSAPSSPQDAAAAPAATGDCCCRCCCGRLVNRTGRRAGSGGSARRLGSRPQEPAGRSKRHMGESLAGTLASSRAAGHLWSVCKG